MPFGLLQADSITINNNDIRREQLDVKLDKDVPTKEYEVTVGLRLVIAYNNYSTWTCTFQANFT